MTRDEVEAILADLAPPSRSLVQQSILDGAAILLPKGDGPFVQFRTDPVRYVREVLKMEPWSMQIEALELLASPQDDDWQGKLAIGAGVGTGKTALGGMITNWYFDCFGPCIIATTAPSQQSVKDLLWKEVRIQRARADNKWGIGEQDFIGPQATEMRRAPDWWARGYVAAKGENFKGRHVHNMMFMFDEAVGLSELYFRATKLMFKPKTSMLWLAFFNPTDTTSTMYQEIIRPDSTWKVIELSCFDHPNIHAALNDQPLPIPSGVSLEQVEEAMLDDCEPVSFDDHIATDFVWPPEEECPCCKGKGWVE